MKYLPYSHTCKKNILRQFIFQQVFISMDKDTKNHNNYHSINIALCTFNVTPITKFGGEVNIAFRWEISFPELPLDFNALVPEAIQGLPIR